MEELYQELWRKHSPVVRYFYQDILQPEYWDPPARHAAVPEPDTRKTISPQPLLKIVEQQQLVAIQRVQSRVPVGKRVILARKEYGQITEKIKSIAKVPVAEEDKSTGGHGILRDYLVTGHPGCGMSNLFFLSLTQPRMLNPLNNRKICISHLSSHQPPNSRPANCLSSQRFSLLLVWWQP